MRKEITLVVSSEVYCDILNKKIEESEIGWTDSQDSQFHVSKEAINLLPPDFRNRPEWYERLFRHFRSKLSPDALYKGVWVFRSNGAGFILWDYLGTTTTKYKNVNEAIEEVCSLRYQSQDSCFHIFENGVLYGTWAMVKQQKMQEVYVIARVDMNAPTSNLNGIAERLMDKNKV
jgi:hypothetical protein